MATTECNKNSSNAYIPKTAYQGSAGYDIWVSESKVGKP